MLGNIIFSVRKLRQSAGNQNYLKISKKNIYSTAKPIIAKCTSPYVFNIKI